MLLLWQEVARSSRPFFRIADVMADYFTAKSKCEALSGTLVEITSQADLDDFNAFRSSKANIFFTHIFFWLVL